MKDFNLRRPAIVFVGFRHKTDSVQSAKEAGCDTILLTTKAVPLAKKLFDHIFEIDLKHADAILAILPELKKKFKVRGVLTNYEHYVVLRSYIAEHLGVPTSSVYSASCTRNKALQRHALEFLPENIPARRVENLAEAKKAWKDLGKDCFVKNISGVKSKLIFHVRTEEELENAVENMISGSRIPDEDLYDAYEFMNFHFRYPNPNKTFIVEKTVSGSLYSVDSIVGSRRIWHCPSLVETITARELGIKDSYLAYRLLPSKLDPELIKKLKSVVEGAIRILGLRNCAIHAELMVDKDGGIHLIELASRLGGYRQDMYMHAYDLDLSERLIKAVTGGEVKTRKKHKKVVAMIEFFADKECAYKGFSGWNKKELDKSMKLHFFREPELGAKLGPAKLGYPPALKIMLEGDNYEQLDQFCRALFLKLKID